MIQQSLYGEGTISSRKASISLRLPGRSRTSTKSSPLSRFPDRKDDDDNFFPSPSSSNGELDTLHGEERTWTGRTNKQSQQKRTKERQTKDFLQQGQVSSLSVNDEEKKEGSIREGTIDADAQSSTVFDQESHPQHQQQHGARKRDRVLAVLTKIKSKSHRQKSPTKPFAKK